MVDEIETMISKERSKNGTFEDLKKDFRDKIGKKRSFKYLHVRNWSWNFENRNSSSMQLST